MNNKKLLLNCLDFKNPKILNEISIKNRNFLKKLKNNKKDLLIFCTLQEYIQIKKLLTVNKSLKKVLIVKNENEKILNKIFALVMIFVHCNLKKLTFAFVGRKDFYINTFNPFVQNKFKSKLNFNFYFLKLYLKNIYYFFKNNYLIIYHWIDISN